MRSFVRRTLILASCACTAVVWSGCDGKKVTEYVPGVSTQVVVPRDLKAIRVEVSVGGISQFCQGYQVYNNRVLLPRSLGNFANSAATIGAGPVSYTISGLTTNDVNADFFALCKAPAVGSDDVRVLRRSRQPFIQDQILFLPMPLKYACYDKDCPAVQGVDQTCKGGKCVPADLTQDEMKALQPYNPDLLDGTGGTCFHTAACMAIATPAVSVDLTKCTYAVANSPNAPPIAPGVANPAPPSGDGVNVEVSYDGGLVHEILDLDPAEGFFVPDPTKPQVFQLAPGLCEMVKGVDDQNKPTTHRITAIRASGTCRAKTINQPICADDQLAAMGLDKNGVTTNPPPTPACSSVVLEPPQSALIVVVDDSKPHQAFFDGLKSQTVDPTNEDTLVSVAVKGALSDPSFERTEIGLVYAPGANGCTSGTGGPRPEKLPLLAQSARDPILADLTSQVPSAPAPLIGAALDRAYTELRRPEYSTFFRRAVLVIANSGFNDATGCVPTKDPIALATTANDSDPTKDIKTYVMQLTKLPAKPAGNWPADALAIAGGTTGAAYKSQEGAAKFEEIVNFLATCVYDTPDTATAPKAGDTVAFTSPLTDVSTTLGFNASCSAPDVGSGPGWGSATPIPGTKRIFLCPDSCTAYRGVLDQATKFTALYHQPPLSIPVFSYRTPDPTTGLCQ